MKTPLGATGGVFSPQSVVAPGQFSDLESLADDVDVLSAIRSAYIHYFFGGGMPHTHGTETVVARLVLLLHTRGFVKAAMWLSLEPWEMRTLLALEVLQAIVTVCMQPRHQSEGRGCSQW